MSENIIEENNDTNREGINPIRSNPIQRKKMKILIPCFVFVAVFISMFWKLNSYPAHLGSMANVSLHNAVNKVLDYEPYISNWWLWGDFHQGNMCNSILYNWFAEGGMRLLGFSMLGIRIFFTIFAFLSLILLYITMSKYYSKHLTILFTFLYGTAAWVLVVTRDGGSVGFSLSLAICALCFTALFIKYRDSYTLPVLAAFFIAILPYGYTILRPLPIVLIIWIILNIKKINIRRFVIFILSLIVLVAPQFTNIQLVAHDYFYARGESLLEVSKSSGKFDTAKFIDKIGENVKDVGALLLGEYKEKTKTFLGQNIAMPTETNKVILYPTFLVPLFLLGLILMMYKLIRTRSIIYLTPLLFFGITLVPSLMSGAGVPNAGRGVLISLPVYFFISFAMYTIGELLPLLMGMIKQQRIATMGKIAIPAILVIFVLFTGGYQFANYFFVDKDEMTIPDRASLTFLIDYLKTHPNENVAYFEFGPFDDWSYVAPRVEGGKLVLDSLKSKKLYFPEKETKDEFIRLLNSGYFDIIISKSDQLKDVVYQGISQYPFEDKKFFKVYYPKRK